MTCAVESPRFWKRSLKLIRCSCSELLVLETDDGLTLAGADASFLVFSVDIAFFYLSWNRCPSPCRTADRFTGLGDSEAVREVHSILSERKKP